MVFKTTLLSLLASWFQTNPNTMERIGVTLAQEGIIEASGRGASAKHLSAKEVICILLFAMVTEKRTAKNVHLVKQFYDLEHKAGAALKSICGVMPKDGKVILGDFLVHQLEEDSGKDILSISINRNARKAVVKWWDESLKEYDSEFSHPQWERIYAEDRETYKKHGLWDHPVNNETKITREGFLYLKSLYLDVELDELRN